MKLEPGNLLMPGGVALALVALNLGLQRAARPDQGDDRIAMGAQGETAA